MQATLERLAAIKPGVNYPASVTVEEPHHTRLTFLLQSYYVGMYCAIHVNESRMPHQAGDHNNKTFVTKLKRDLKKALTRGAVVELGPLHPIKIEI